MAVVDARVKNGVLKFTASGGGSASVAEDFSCQIRAVKITPSTGTEGDNEEVLCGDIIPGESATNDDKLEFTLIQDWTNIKGYQAFSWLHRGETVAFEVQFDGDALNKWTGTVVMDATQIGGPVDEKTTVDVSLKIVTLVPPVAFGSGTGAVTKLAAADKGAAAPGDVFPAEATITASDTSSAGKLGAAGFTASPASAWTTGQKITVGTYDFSWDGSAWAVGAAS